SRLARMACSLPRLQHGGSWRLGRLAVPPRSGRVPDCARSASAACRRLDARPFLVAPVAAFPALLVSTTRGGTQAPGARRRDAAGPAVVDGARVVIHAKPDFWVNRGSFSLSAIEVKPVGVGELLARLERLKQLLSAEGLFRPERKRRPPFLPHKIGLICGRDS